MSESDNQKSKLADKRNHHKVLRKSADIAGNSMIEIKRKVAAANRIKIHYRECGSGPPIVLLHGWPQTSYAWRKVMPRLAPHYRCIAPDLRGMGHTAKPLIG